MKSYVYQIIVAVLLGGIILWLFLSAYYNNDGYWVYPLDDTYIHLSIAQNLWKFGNWSVVPTPPQFSSSSPLYTLILALLGAPLQFPVYLPLGVNIAVGIGLYLWVCRYMFRLIPSPLFASILLIGFLLLLPFHLLVLLGMEHLLHVWLALLFIQEIVPKIEREGQEAFKDWNVFLCLGLLSLCRYESLFLVGAASAVFLLRKRYASGIRIAHYGTVLLLILGFFQWNWGATFLPLSVLAKSQLVHLPHNLFSPLNTFVVELYDNPFMLVLALALITLPPLIRLAGKEPYPLLSLKILICLLTMLLHMLAASVGGYRYEAYVVGVALFLIIEGYVYIGKSVKREGATQRWMLAAGLLWVFPLFIRSSFFSANFVLSTQNIYQQQIQMARFISAYYPTSGIAANDIGAITYFNEITLLDFAFIGDQDLFERSSKGKGGAEEIQIIARERGVSIAMVYPSFTRNKIPSDWQEVATWTIPDNFICAGETVAFYAVSNQAKHELRNQLKAFDEELPDAVRVTYVGE